MKISHLFAVSLLLSIMACGGGGGGSEQTPEQPASSSPTPTPISAVLQTIDLLAPDDFKYRSSKKVRFVIEVLSLENQRAFVSIFSEYQLTDTQQWRPNFGSRILVQKLIDGQLEVSLMVDNNVKRVLIEIWTDRPEEQPYILESAIENGELVWRI